MKVLFIHNTLPEYRLEFFKELSKQVELHIAVTDIQLANSVYGLSFKKDIREFNKQVQNYEMFL